jgi:predicted dehydrogenase
MQDRKRTTAHPASGPEAGSYSRRAVLGAAAATAAWASLPLAAHAQKRSRFSANDRVNVAMIGAGGKGADNAAALISQNIVAIADVDFDRVGKQMLDKTGALKPSREALKAAYDKSERFGDYRRMLDARKDIEAVVIATPDHHHALAARMAMERGIHVYVQKPLTTTVREARALLALSRKYPQLVTQMGNQGHSGNDGRRVIELIRGGAIGKVHNVQIWTDRPIWPQGIVRPAAVPAPEGLDWDTWLGPADVNWGYNSAYAHFNWRGWVPFGSGAIGDMGAHLMDFPVWALEPGLPTRIETRHTLWGGQTDPVKKPAELASLPLGSVTTYEFGHARHGPLTFPGYDGGLRPPTPRGLPADRIMDLVGGVLFIGDKGMLIHDTYGEKPTVIGEEAKARAAKIKQTLPRIAGGSGGHEMNWIRAIRGEEPASSPFEVSAVLTETMLLGNVALRADQPIDYDGAAGKITNSDAANNLLDRAYRKGWEL